ncbi:hypothetical protein BC828DRAFT_391007 [Blastocladiella britannica]|nr:hypothetical protein BC828DRAFT_391007 [Blastocladiella britannica]
MQAQDTNRLPMTDDESAVADYQIPLPWHYRVLEKITMVGSMAQVWIATWVLYPDIPSHATWQLIVMAASVMQAVLVPYVVAFDVSEPTAYGFISTAWLALLADMFVGMRTAYADEDGETIDDTRVLLFHYARVQGWYDVMSNLPLDLLVPVSAVSSEFAHRALMLNRLLALSKAKGWIKARELKLTGSLLIQLYKFLLVLLLTIHLYACAWWVIGLPAADGTETWSMHDPNRHSSEDLHTDEMAQHKWIQYIYSAYWVVNLITVPGFADLEAPTFAEKMIGLGMFLSGMMLFGWVTASVTSILANRDSQRSRFQQKLLSVRQYMDHNHFDQTTRNRVSNYYDYLWKRNKGIDAKTIFADLPTTFQAELALGINGHIISKVPLFADTEIGFMRMLSLALQPVLFLPNEYVVKKGDIGSEMFFIHRGRVDVVSEEGAVVFATMNEGSFFGEIALFLSRPRTASIRASTYTDIYVLSKQNLDEVLSYYPIIKERILLAATERLRENEARQKQQLQQLHQQQLQQQQAVSPAPPAPPTDAPPNDGAAATTAPLAQDDGNRVMVTTSTADAGQVLTEKDDGVEGHIGRKLYTLSMTLATSPTPPAASAAAAAAPSTTTSRSQGQLDSDTGGDKQTLRDSPKMSSSTSLGPLPATAAKRGSAVRLSAVTLSNSGNRASIPVLSPVLQGIHLSAGRTSTGAASHTQSRHGSRGAGINSNFHLESLIDIGGTISEDGEVILPDSLFGMLVTNIPETPTEEEKTSAAEQPSSSEQPEKPISHFFSFSRRKAEPARSSATSSFRDNPQHPPHGLPSTLSRDPQKSGRLTTMHRARSGSQGNTDVKRNNGSHGSQGIAAIILAANERAYSLKRGLNGTSATSATASSDAGAPGASSSLYRTPRQFADTSASSSGVLQSPFMSMLGSPPHQQQQPPAGSGSHFGSEMIHPQSFSSTNTASIGILQPRPPVTAAAMAVFNQLDPIHLSIPGLDESDSEEVVLSSEAITSSSPSRPFQPPR